MVFGVSALPFQGQKASTFRCFQILNPKAKLHRKYGVYRKQDGITERALFVIDNDGIIQWSYVSPIGINPGAEGILKALESISKPTKEQR